MHNIPKAKTHVLNSKFPEYYMPYEDLCKEFNISIGMWSSFPEQFEELLRHCPDMAYHSLRVGFYAAELGNAQYAYLQTPHLLMGGLMHDVGKIDIDQRDLYAEPFTDENRCKCEKHALCGYERLKKISVFVALVAGMHHQFQENSYGIEDPQALHPYYSDHDVNYLLEVTEVVSFCDFFDALTTRSETPLTTADIHSKMDEAGRLDTTASVSSLQVLLEIKKEFENEGII